MEKSSKIICLGILVFCGLIVMPLLGFKDTLNIIFPVAGSIIIAYGIYSKGPEFRDTHHKSYLAMILGIALFVLFFLITLLAGSAVSIPYVPSLITLFLLGGIFSFGYGLYTYIKSPEYQDRHSRNNVASSKDIDKKEESSPDAAENGYDKWQIPKGIFSIIIGVLFVWFATWSVSFYASIGSPQIPGIGLLFIAGIIMFFGGIYTVIMGIVHFIKR